MTRDLDDALAALRDAPAPMPRALRSRILADAAAARPAPVRPAPWWRIWPGLAGLSAAALTGLWIGGTQPEAVWDVVPGLVAQEAVFEDVFAGPLLGDEA
ncbi:hypothetical protein ACK8OR_13340 [Jannaschia sp. KMU-145]|uniref:hypothetical protein n=1 Tax=Jannaschia halovivens TaxID=3388667 RepID=UPI00396B3A3D